MCKVQTVVGSKYGKLKEKKTYLSRLSVAPLNANKMILLDFIGVTLPHVENNL